MTESLTKTNSGKLSKGNSGKLEDKTVLPQHCGSNTTLESFEKMLAAEKNTTTKRQEETDRLQALQNSKSRYYSNCFFK